MNKRKWQKSELEYLKANYSIVKMSEIAAVLGRGKAGIHHKAKKLGLVNSNVYWMQAHKDYVQKYFSKKSIAQITEATGRSHHAIMQMAGKLGLRGTQHQWSEQDIQYLKKNYPDKNKPLAEIAEHLGVSISSVVAAAQKRYKCVRKEYIPEARCIDCGYVIYKYRHESIRCISCSGKFRSGENHSNWKGGISKLIDTIRRALYPVWTFPIMERDSFSCQYCGNKKGVHVHHIRPLKEIKDEVLKNHPGLSVLDGDDKIKIAALIIAQHRLEEGITVCKSCHIKIHYSENRVNCGNIFRATDTTTQLETANVMVQKVRGLDNPQPSLPNVIDFVGEKVHRTIAEEITTNKANKSARNALVQAL